MPKQEIDNTQKKNKYRICRNRKETGNHINECRKLKRKEYKSRYDWVGKVIH